MTVKLSSSIVYQLLKAEVLEGDNLLFQTKAEAVSFQKRNPQSAQTTINVNILAYQKVLQFYKQIYPKDVNKFLADSQDVDFFKQGYNFIQELVDSKDACKLFKDRFGSIKCLYKEAQKEKAIINLMVVCCKIVRRKFGFKPHPKHAIINKDAFV